MIVFKQEVKIIRKVIFFSIKSIDNNISYNITNFDAMSWINYTRYMIVVTIIRMLFRAGLGKFVAIYENTGSSNEIQTIKAERQKEISQILKMYKIILKKIKVQPCEDSTTEELFDNVKVISLENLEAINVTTND